MKLKLNTDLKGVITPPVSSSFPKRTPGSDAGDVEPGRPKEPGVGSGVTHQLVEGECLFSSVLVQGLYQLICSAALPQNLSGSVTEAAKWVLYSPPPEDSALQPRPPRAPRGPGAKYARRAGPAPRAGEDAGRDPPRPPAPVTLRHCSQDGFIAAGGVAPSSPKSLQAPPRAARNAPPVGRSRLPGAPSRAGGRREKTPRCAQSPGTLEGTTRVAGKNRPGAAGGSPRLQRGRGAADGWGSPRPGDKPGASAAPRFRREGAPPRHPRAPKASTAGPVPPAFQQTS